AGPWPGRAALRLLPGPCARAAWAGRPAIPATPVVPGMSALFLLATLLTSTARSGAGECGREVAPLAGPVPGPAPGGPTEPPLLAPSAWLAPAGPVPRVPPLARRPPGDPLPDSGGPRWRGAAGWPGWAGPETAGCGPAPIAVAGRLRREAGGKPGTI